MTIQQFRKFRTYYMCEDRIVRRKLLEIRFSGCVKVYGIATGKLWLKTSWKFQADTPWNCFFSFLYLIWYFSLTISAPGENGIFKLSSDIGSTKTCHFERFSYFWNTDFCWFRCCNNRKPITSPLSILLLIRGDCKMRWPYKNSKVRRSCPYSEFVSLTTSYFETQSRIGDGSTAGKAY